MLDSAIALASEKFKGVFDKGGKPYILHCLHVMYDVDQTDEELMIIAVLHDIVEDTNVALGGLSDRGYSDRVVNAIDGLTRRKNETYTDFIKRCALNPDSLEVKLSDLRHNSQIMRMKGVEQKDLDRISKYFKSYQYLLNVKQSLYETEFDAG